MQKHKRAEYEEANSWRGCLSRGSVSHKGTPYIHVVESLTKIIASRQSSLSRELNHGHLNPEFH